MAFAPNIVFEQTPADRIRNMAALLVYEAERAGMRITIERSPLQPLAMGHAEHVVTVYPDHRDPAATEPQQ